MVNTKKSKKEKKEKMVTPRKSVHVVFLSCPHCGTERDHIETCLECNETMRVIDVVEKFGEDAERFLKRAQKRNAGKKIKEDDYVSIDNEEPNIILMGDDDALNSDGGIDPNGDDDASLGVIFPDDDEDEDGERKEVQVDADDDLTKALEQLDSEEDDDLTAEDFGFEDGEIPTL